MRAKENAIVSFTGLYSFLSNFYVFPVSYEGVMYPSLENAYQAAKTEDVNMRRNFENCTAGEAKKFGRKVVLRPGWDKIRLKVMEELLRNKFSSDLLRSKLLDTGDQQLIEGNFWGDRFWGVYHGSGDNHLGKLLMKIRAELRNGH